MQQSGLALSTSIAMFNIRTWDIEYCVARRKRQLCEARYDRIQTEPILKKSRNHSLRRIITRLFTYLFTINVINQTFQMINP